MTCICNGKDESQVTSKSLEEVLMKVVFETCLRHFSLQCPNDNTKKVKGHFCAYGDQQFKMIDFFEI